MTATEKIVTAEEIFSDYILNCYTPDDFRNMSIEMWAIILPEIEEYYTDIGRVFLFTEAEIPLLKSTIDTMFDAEFGKEM